MPCYPMVVVICCKDNGGFARTCLLTMLYFSVEFSLYFLEQKMVFMEHKQMVSVYSKAV